MPCALRTPAHAQAVSLPPLTTWTAYGKGFQADTTVTHGGKASLRCVNPDTGATTGALYTLTLNQTTPIPIFVSGWSKAQDVDGVSDNEYSLYVDLTFTDGTSLWGQTAPFGTGTHDWQSRHLTLFPTKPLRSVNVYALFRSHAGTAWFDDFEAHDAASGTVFDGQDVAPPVLPKSQTSGWFVRDVAAGTPLTRLQTGQTTLGLRLEDVKNGSGGRVTRASLRNLTASTRAVSVYYVERFDAPHPAWWNDVNGVVPAQPNQEYGNLTPVNVGATGQISLYPFGCVTGQGAGRAVALPPDLGPRVARIGFHARSRTFFLVCDFALAGAGDPAGHDRAPVAVAHYDADPKWGFRDAVAKYEALFPDAYQRRTKAEGIWMPFTDPSKVTNPQDFGFAFHEGDNSIASDKEQGILSFHYVEPMTYWMPMAKGVPRIYAEALAQIQKQAAGGDETARRQSQAVLASGTQDTGGKLNVAFRDAPWCDGAVWVLNPNPKLPTPPGQWSKAKLNADTGTVPPDGLYLDSLEAWADVLDYRPESLNASALPPAFTTDTFRPALPTWFSVYEDAAALSRDLHKHGRLLMANSVPWRFSAFLPLLDVAGTEANTFSDTGDWQPEPEAVLNLRRTLSGRKPYLLLLNTDFTKVSADKIALYFQRCLFYGIAPSMFSVNAADHPYWENPALYNRDRPLFQKYVPVIRRLSAAGWEPVTWARADHPDVRVERFGREYLTVLNVGTSPADASLRLDVSHFAPGADKDARLIVKDVLTGRVLVDVPAHGIASVSLHLAASETAVLSVSTH